MQTRSVTSLHGLTRLPAIFALAFALWIAPASATGLRWDASQATLEANVTHWPVNRVLEALANETGWEVYVDPEIEAPISSSFGPLGVAEGLRRLLGELSFSLSPQPSGKVQLCVYSNSPRDATHVIRGQGEPDPDQQALEQIARELIIRVEPGKEDAIAQLVGRLGGTIEGASPDGEALRLRFANPEAASAAEQALEQSDLVASVEANEPVRPPYRLEPIPPGAMNPPPIRAAANSPDGQVTVALVDTAVVSSAEAWLDSFLLPAVEVAGPGGSQADTLTHGTAMAETLVRALASSVPGAEQTAVKILPVDVYGDKGVTSTFDVLNGVLAAAQQNPDIINLSLGSQNSSPMLEQTLLALKDAGVLIVAAAGNEPSGQPVFPAAYPSVLAVTAGDAGGQIANYANRGDFVDLVAPGTSVVHYDDTRYLGTGTSYASAFVSGVAAAHLSQPGSDPATTYGFLDQNYGLSGAQNGPAPTARSLPQLP